MNVSFFTLLYADDTLLREDDPTKMEALLHAVEDVSEIFGLNLNRSKCRQLSWKGRVRSVKFRDGETEVIKEDVVEYLGTLLEKEANPRPEIIRRINNAAYVRKKLEIFWAKARLNKRQKILMYEALISSKLLYALEAIPIPKQMYDRIDASYLKGFRQILNFKTTFGQMQDGEARTNSNLKLMEAISKELSTKKKQREFTALSDRIIDRAIRLLGRTIRMNPDEPIHEVVMQGDTWVIPQKGGNRVGHPCTNWLIETARHAWRKHNLYEKVEGPLEEFEMDFIYKNPDNVKVKIQAARVGVL